MHHKPRVNFLQEWDIYLCSLFNCFSALPSKTACCQDWCNMSLLIHPVETEASVGIRFERLNMSALTGYTYIKLDVIFFPMWTPCTITEEKVLLVIQKCFGKILTIYFHKTSWCVNFSTKGQMGKSSLSRSIFWIHTLQSIQVEWSLENSTVLSYRLPSVHSQHPLIPTGLLLGVRESV